VKAVPYTNRESIQLGVPLSRLPPTTCAVRTTVPVNAMSRAMSVVVLIRSSRRSVLLVSDVQSAEIWAYNTCFNFPSLPTKHFLPQAFSGLAVLRTLGHYK